MRIYQNFPEALGEIKRDLAEMGIRIHPKTYQDKNVEGNPDFDAFELQNYIFTVTDPQPGQLEPSQPWADAEFLERISRAAINPGEAWKLRREIWEEFLVKSSTGEDRFAYTYAERFGEFQQLDRLITQLQGDSDSRQIFLSVWNPSDVLYLGGKSRVPCSLGYYFQLRQGQLNMTYLQRSADYATHFVNDIYLATLLMRYVAQWVGAPLGHYTHWLGSLHIFAKDAQGVF